MTFELDEEELKKFEEWKSHIHALYGTDKGFVFEISTGSGIGLGLSVRCKLTGLKLDLTDYSKW